MGKTNWILSNEPNIEISYAKNNESTVKPDIL